MAHVSAESRTAADHTAVTVSLNYLAPMSEKPFNLAYPPPRESIESRAFVFFGPKD